MRGYLTTPRPNSNRTGSGWCRIRREACRNAGWTRCPCWGSCGSSRSRSRSSGLELDPELLPDPELVLPDDPELVPPDPEFPVLVLVDGVLVEELDVELEPELPVVFEVVAALATKAPPATRPDVRAPIATMLRRRICMGGLSFQICLLCRSIRERLRHELWCGRRATWVSVRKYLTKG